jgi:hypothetical protein
MWSQLRWHKWQQVYDENGLESHRACRNCGRMSIPVPNARPSGWRASESDHPGDATGRNRGSG